MLVYVSLLVCLSSQPGFCKTVTLSTTPSAGIAACQIEGQQEGAQYVDRHPGWRLAQVRCTIGQPRPDESAA
jgi:hypothetical protein